MEIMELVDIQTPTSRDIMYALPRNVNNGPCGRPTGFNRTEEVEGSNPSRSTWLTEYYFAGRITVTNHGPIAQLGARLNGIEKVEGSNPSGSTQTNACVVKRLVNASQSLLLPRL